MARLPTIVTARTRIRPFTLEDITPEYIGWLNDAEIVKFSRQRLLSHDWQSCFAFLKSFQNSPNHFSAIFDCNNEHIGNVSVFNDLDNLVSDISILIGNKSIWGQGYGYEVWTGIMEHLFTLNIRMITGGCMANNAGMIKVMEKSGMKLYFVREKYFIFDGRPVDSVHYFKESEVWG